MGVVRTIGIARARIKIGTADLVYRFQRLAWFEGRTVPAWRKNPRREASRGRNIRQSNLGNGASHAQTWNLSLIMPYSTRPIVSRPILI